MPGTTVVKVSVASVTEIRDSNSDYTTLISYPRSFTTSIETGTVGLPGPPGPPGENDEFTFKTYNRFSEISSDPNAQQQAIVNLGLASVDGGTFN